MKMGASEKGTRTAKRTWLSWGATVCVALGMLTVLGLWSTPYGRFVRNIGRAVVVNNSNDEIVSVRLLLSWSDERGKNEWMSETGVMRPGEERTIDVDTADLHVNEVTYTIKGAKYRHIISEIATSGTTVGIVIDGPQKIRTTTGFHPVLK